jgi:hypothetical protein
MNDGPALGGDFRTSLSGECLGLRGRERSAVVIVEHGHGPRADALRGYDPDAAPQCCSACSRPVLALFKLPRRYRRAAPVCSACYLELVGRSALVPWRDSVDE